MDMYTSIDLVIEKNDRKVLVPFDDFTIPEKCEMDMLQI